MKILHILDHSLPVHSGYAFRSQSLLLEQKKRGWDPIVVTSPKHYDDYRGEWTESEVVGDIRYYRTPQISLSTLPLESERRIMTALGKGINDIVRRLSPKILHAHSPILNAIPALWVSRKSGIPMIYELRALWEDAAVDHGTYAQNSLKYKAVRSVETWVCRRAAHVTVICEGLRNDLIERGISPDKITIIPNGVDIESFHSLKPDLTRLENWNLKGKKIVGFIGSFFRYEGLDLLIEAFARLCKSRSDVGLVLVGAGRAEAELKAQVKRLGIEDIVAMPGSIPPKSVPEIYALIDILVYPRHSIRLTELVTPLKPLEAMAMGKAFIASDVGGHRELVQHERTGLLFEAGNSSALVAGLQRLLNDSDLRAQIGKQAACWVQQQRSWEKTTSEYLTAYSKALS